MTRVNYLKISDKRSETLRIEQKRVGDVQAPGGVELLPDGGGVVEKNEVGSVLTVHIGEVVSAQLVGEKDDGFPLLDALLELFLGEADALSIGGGEEEVLGRPLHRQGYPCRAVLLDGLLKPHLEGAAGQGGGDEHLGRGGVTAIRLRDVEGPAPLGQQRGEPAITCPSRGRCRSKSQITPV